MKRELRLTEDGSFTIYVPEMDEPYHSIHGAIQESRHVFIGHGLQSLDLPKLRILEIGFGTGLNALLTLVEAGNRGLTVDYHAVEKYPLLEKEYSSINFEALVKGVQPGTFKKLHEVIWEEPVAINDYFTLFKEETDVRSMSPGGNFDLVYFDAFAPQKQAHLWTEEVFRSLSCFVKPGGVLVTYTCKGSVRRALISCGFEVVKVPGPPGKREMIRATMR